MHRHASIVAACLFVALFATPAGAQPTFQLDHYNLYNAAGPAPPVGGVQLTDQFGSITTTLGPLLHFLVPADKNGEGIHDPFGHLSCYQITDPGPPGPVVIATHQFGASQLTLGSARELCVPTVKLIQPGPSPLDHYQCYPAAGNPLQVSVSLSDQFNPALSTVLFDPFLFCNPVDKNGEGIGNVVDHLACYSYTPPGAPFGTVPIQHQFFPNPTDIEVLDSQALCLPAAKQVVTDAVDHFTLYKANGPFGPQVAIADQFGTQVADLGPIDLFMVPASKNTEPIMDPFSHLACHPLLPPGPPGPPQVVVTNQVGEHVLDVLGPRDFCVPTEKLITPGPVSLDHFRCWDVTGPRADFPVTWTDQFQSYTGVLMDPFLLCNPADKNGEGIVNPDDHLVCYNVAPGTPIGTVPIANQFFPQTQIEVFEAIALCLTSAKRIPDPVEHFAVYRALGDDAPIVTLTDQFGTRTTDLDPANLFMVPITKNGENLVDRISHLACHPIVDGGDPLQVRQVDVTNQFGDQQLAVQDARELCVPTEKVILTPGPVTLDHFECYNAIGTPPDVSIDWVDQFQSAGVTVRDPFLHCNPVSKNGEAIQNPIDHLVCYLTEPEGQPVGPVDILNQFTPVGQVGLIDVQQPFAVCATSDKTFVPEPGVGLGLGAGLLLVGALARRRSRA